MQRILLAANWKMNGSESLLKDFAVAFAKTPVPSSVEVVLCLPFVYLPLAQQLFKQTTIQWGAQDVSGHQPGAFTGEISAQMLQEFGCSYAIIGHSERRILCKEGDTLIAEKFARLKDASISPILCVGETHAQRENGETTAVISTQLSAIVQRVGVAAFQNTVIAYEPVWAIGAGNAAKPEDVEAVHNQIYHYFAGFDETLAATIRVIYGGSMNENNVKSLITLPSVGGGLVGGASLKPASFAAIIAASRK